MRTKAASFILAALFSLASGSSLEGTASVPNSPKGSSLLQAKHSSKRGLAVSEEEVATAPAPAPLEPQATPLPEDIAAQIAEMQNAQGHLPGLLQKTAGTEGWVNLADKSMAMSTEPASMGKIIDDDGTTFGGAVVFVMDLGTIYAIDQWFIDWYVCQCEAHESVFLEYSQDGVKYNTFATPNLYAWGDHVAQTYYAEDQDAVGRYWRVRTTSAAGLQWSGFWNMAMHGQQRHPNQYGWYQTYAAGPPTILGGTEILHLLPYKGALFGGTGYWMNTGPFRPAEIVRLDCPFCDWVIETAIGQWAGRAELLKDITWTTDAAGNTLPTPVDKLITAYYMDWGGEARNFAVAREDGMKIWHADAYWIKSPFMENYYSARCAAMHKDTVTGVDMLFLTTGRDGITSATYDSASSLKMSFAGQSETGQVPTRPLGIVEMDDKLYFTASSYIKRRTDGPSPTWSTVFDMADVDAGVTVDEAVGGIRGISVVPHAGANSLFFSWSPNENSAGCLVRLDPDGDSFTHTQEACVRDMFADYLGPNVEQMPALVTFTISNYNRILDVPQATGDPIQLIGFEVLLYSYTAHDFAIDPAQMMQTSSGQRIAFYAGAGYLVRTSPTSYEVREPRGPRYNPLDIYPKLTAVRTLSTSPFPGDRAIYMGGYDCNHHASSNTAWAMRSEDWAAYKEPVPCKPELGCGHVPGDVFAPRGCDWCAGFEFYPSKIAYWSGGNPVLCQAVLDWLNIQYPNSCPESQEWPLAGTCCGHSGCNFCAGNGLDFEPNNIAGLDGQGNPYSCQVALDWTLSGGTTCSQASTWWSGVCCM